MDVEESNNRRLQIIEHTKQIKLFAESNIPLMIENLVDTCTQEITMIRN